MVSDHLESTLSSFCKYCSDNESIINSIFINNKIRFTQPKALNDPLEFNPTLIFNDNDAFYKRYELNGILLPTTELFLRVQIIERNINDFGILSLTKTPDSFDMWSRYSNGHKGFLIELKTDFWRHNCMKSKTENPFGLKKVDYVEDYSINLENFANGDQILNQDVLNYLFFKKIFCWKHENEYRMVRPLIDCPDFERLNLKRLRRKYSYVYEDKNKYLFDFDWECINSVVFGARMSKENKNLISRCCEDHGINLFQAHIIRDKLSTFNTPEVILIELSDTRYRKHCLESEAFITDMHKISEPKTGFKTIQIKKLAELPYYRGYENIVEQYYKNINQRNRLGN